MGNEKVIDVEGELVRFTPNGRMFVLDAISLLGSCDTPHIIWDRMKSEHPDILKYCEDYDAKNGEPMPVVAVDGWERVLMLLPDYLFGESFD